MTSASCEKCGHVLRRIDGGWVAWGFREGKYQIGRFPDAEMPHGTIFAWLYDSFGEKLSEKYPGRYCPRGHTMQTQEEGEAI